MISDRHHGNQSFLGHVFDTYQNMMQIARCLREASLQTRIAQPRLLELSRRPTSIQDYFPEADWVRYPTHKNDAPLLKNPVKLPFADASFDGCLISDVYEHIPADWRPGLLKEMLRVTNGLVLVASPNGNELVSKLDRVVFDFIWGKYGERFTPLAQHVEFGVEPLEQILKTLKDQGADRVTVLPANYVYRWIHMILIYFDLQHRNPYSHVFNSFNEIYNERLSPFDYREPCYRYLIAIPTNPDLDLDELNRALESPVQTTAPASETDEMLLKTFFEIDSKAADELRRTAVEIGRLESLQLATKEQNSQWEKLLRDSDDETSRLRESLVTSQKNRLELDEANSRLRSRLKEIENADHIGQLSNQLAVKEAQLAAAEAELKGISNSLGWRLLSRYGPIKYKYLLPLYRILGLSHQERSQRQGNE
ncbi:MAG TPA: hypothetical protein VEW46_11140 [Pyrinomonadaceae bacterium]|nr:hypothetical protein [Pyrinomonadaceae bacterium]